MYLRAVRALVLWYGVTLRRAHTRTTTHCDMKVAIFGLGYVGTVTAACLAANGHEVWGVDPDELKVAAVLAGTSPFAEPGLQTLVAQSVASGKLHASVQPADALESADISLLCVGTPSGTSGETNLAYIYRVVEDLAKSFADLASTRPFHTVVIRSTVPPGTVEDVNAVLQSAFQDTGPDVGVAMCPEFLREGTGVADFYAPPYTVIGSSDLRAIDAVSRLFSFLESPRSSCASPYR